MDLTILIGIASILLVILLFLQAKKTSKDGDIKQEQRGVPQQAQNVFRRRARNPRNHRQNDRNRAELNDGGQEEQSEIPKGEVLDEKMGAKKRAKMEQKQQKRLFNQQMQVELEALKVKKEEMELKLKKQEEREAEEERKQEEAERLAREEQERKEHEEYLKMKAEFSVEEEGFEEGEEEKENLLADFIKYIKDNKVVVLEDLSAEFKLKNQHTIERIKELQANGSITGVIDDRGKFIYISEEELMSVAKFIKQRGRVSIAELAESSNNLINLTPIQV